MSSITMNGVTYSGRNVSIINGSIIIDGVTHTSNDKVINVTINGDIGELSVDSCEYVSVTGNVTGSVKSVSGDILIDGNVSGDAKSTSGSIKCGDVGGKITTVSGSIKHRKT